MDQEAEDSASLGPCHSKHLKTENFLPQTTFPSLKSQETKNKARGKIRRFSPVPYRAALDKDLADAPFRTLGALCAYVNKEGLCFPSQTTIADDLGISRKAVSKSIKKLEESGYILRQKRSRKNGSQTSSSYKILYDDCQSDVACMSTQGLQGAQPIELPTQQPGADTHNYIPEQYSEPREDGGFKIQSFLSDDAIARAKVLAPGWDIDFLFQRYNEGINAGSREAPRNPGMAFPAWCTAFTKGKAAKASTSVPALIEVDKTDWQDWQLKLAEKLDPAIVKSWFVGVREEKNTAGEIIRIHVGTKFKVSYIIQHYLDGLRAVLPDVEVAE